MSNTEEEKEEATKPFLADRPKRGKAKCKKCKQPCEQGDLRMGKLVPNPFGEGKMKAYYHVNCMFETLLRQKKTSKCLEDTNEIDGFELLNQEDQDLINKELKVYHQEVMKKFGFDFTSQKKETPQKVKPSPKHVSDDAITEANLVNHKDNLFREFRRLLTDISNVSSYGDKTAFVENLFKFGRDNNGFKGDIVLWCRLLLPGVVKRIYNLQSKQLVKLFSRLFNSKQESMLEHLEQGDVSETIQHYFELSKRVQPATKSSLTLKEVDDFLEELSQLTKEEEQLEHFRSFIIKCTSNDLKILIRLIKHDLRMNAGAKHILDGVHPNAYEAYQSSRDIAAVIKRCLNCDESHENRSKNDLRATITLMTPVLPMLAEACKSVEQAMKKCPNGMYSEIKYDGERVQVHKRGSDFKYFSRSLKPVMPHKVAHFKDYIPEAFPHAKDLILDSEILMVDTNTGKPLPFGTLGVHKKTAFKDASVCLFVFDCIYYNGEILTHKPLRHRKKILRDVMTEIPNHIMFSELEEIYKPEDLSAMIAKVLKLGLEGLVLKDSKSIYEPGKRHWLKVKKDYLFGGAMADSADLIVLGAWYGTGKKGGMMSVFLMGCYDSKNKGFCTVTKVHTGHDDKTLEQLQKELDMIKISGDATKVPNWLNCTKTMVPDFVARDPKKQPVWEITGAEFTQQHDVHTADGISIRFPRVTKIRDDKHWESATTVQELSVLFKKSKENTDVSLLMKELQSDAGSSSSSSLQSEKSPKVKKAIEEKSPKGAVADFIRKRSPKRKTFNTIEHEPTNKKLKKETVIELPPIKKPIPNYFDGVKLLVEDGVNDRFSEWIRYFIAYGGMVLKAEDYEEATHVLHLKDTVNSPTVKCPKTAKHVIIEWIKHTVSNNKLQDFRPYTVRWDPSI